MQNGMSFCGFITHLSAAEATSLGFVCFVVVGFPNISLGGDSDFVVVVTFCSIIFP